MEPRTRLHHDTAERNRALAASLLDKAPELGLRSPPFEWVAVIAFYAAVHYVNAYLWEQQRYEPPDHQARLLAVGRERGLRAARESYARLFDLAWHARYTPGFRLTATQARSVVDVDLERVRTVVLDLLSIS